MSLSSEYKSNESIIRQWLLHVLETVCLEPENVCDYFNYELIPTLPEDNG